MKVSNEEALRAVIKLFKDTSATMILGEDVRWDYLIMMTIIRSWKK